MDDITLERLMVRRAKQDMCITTQEGGEYHGVVPLHNPIGAKTLSTILKSVTRHQGIDIQELLRKLELQ